MHPTYFIMKKIEIQLTKTQIEQARRLIGLKTKTKPDVVIKSLVKMLLDAPHQLEVIQYEKK